METYRENIEKRVQFMKKAWQDDDYKSLLIEKCRRDIVFFFNYFLYTDKNPWFYWPEYPYEVPFILFDFQEEFIVDLWSAIQEWRKPISERKMPTNVFVEKSRQMWLSWLILWVFVYWYLFHNHKYLCLSQKEDDVDKSGDIKSHFEKIRMMLRLLPEWMLPEWFTKDSGTEFNKYMNISRGDGTWSITGESANPNAGRWGTYDAIFLDEMASMQNASQVNKACARATPCRIFNSTPNGMGNEYYRMKKMAEKWYFQWHRIHWSEHPFYTKEWYDAQCKTMTREQIASELDINYTSSIVWRVYPEFKAEATSMPYNDNLPLYISVDNSHGGADPHAIVVIQPDGHYWNVIDYLEINCSPTDLAKFFGKNVQMKLDDHTLDFYNRYIQWKKATFIADPYDTHSTLNTTTIAKEYMEHAGIYLNTNFTRIKQEQIMLTRANIYRFRFDEKAQDLINCIMNSRYPETPENSNNTKAKELPVHDAFSHGRTAVEYFSSWMLANAPKPKEKTRIEIANPLTGQIEFKYI